MSFRRGSSYGGAKASSGGSWRAPPWRSYEAETQTSLPREPLGPVLDEISLKTLFVEEDAPKIEDVEYVSSYNWLDVKSPEILVPGSPPAWSPPIDNPQLKPDSEAVFRDINAARYPSYPLEPMMRSLRSMQPDFDLRSVDIVGCGSTIGNLLRFAGSLDRPFRFDLAMIGETAFFARKESSPTEMITDLRGYGHTFPATYTTWDKESRRSCSHQRIIRYSFGGLQLLVRSETDGYLKAPGTVQPSSTANTDEKTLEEAFFDVTVGRDGLPQTRQLQMKMAGKKVPQSQIFDLKTRMSIKKPFDLEEILPRLWMNQTPNFLIAYHDRGVFETPEIKDVRQDVLRWEKVNHALLARFHALLKRIVDLLADSSHQQCEVSCDGQGTLSISKQEGELKRVLPHDIGQLFESHE